MDPCLVKTASHTRVNLGIYGTKYTAEDFSLSPGHNHLDLPLTKGENHELLLTGYVWGQEAQELTRINEAEFSTKLFAET